MSFALYKLKMGGIIHCDIKPANIFVEIQPDKTIYVLGDLGAAIIADEDGQDPKKKIMGTPQFMSKGLLSRDECNSFASDLFALGATLLDLALFPRVSEIFNEIEVNFNMSKRDIYLYYVTAWTEFFKIFKENPNETEFKYPFEYKPPIRLDRKVAEMISKYYRIPTSSQA